MYMRAAQAVLHRQFLIFVAVGGLTALVDIGAMLLLLGIGASALLATTFGFALGLMVNYLFHVRMTFVACSTLRSVIRFLIVVAINYGLTVGFVLVAQWLGGSAVVGKVLSLPIVAINGFLFSKLWVFR